MSPAPDERRSGDAEVIRTARAMFQVPGQLARNGRGGMAVFLEQPGGRSLRVALDALRAVYDVQFDGKPLRHIHKVHQNRHIYLFANLHAERVTTRVRLRGHLAPELWNPHTGAIAAAVFSRSVVGPNDVTTVDLTLDPTSSVFVVSPVSR
jgi:hypothetical protein